MSAPREIPRELQLFNINPNSTVASVPELALHPVAIVGLGVSASACCDLSAVISAPVLVTAVAINRPGSRATPPTVVTKIDAGSLRTLSISITKPALSDAPCTHCYRPMRSPDLCH